jgi:copper chaperone CopZ
MTNNVTCKCVKRVTIPVYGFTCAGDEARIIEGALVRLSGIRQVYVNAGLEMAYVAYESAACSLQQIIAAIERAGFKTGQPSLR